MAISILDLELRIADLKNEPPPSAESAATLLTNDGSFNPVAPLPVPTCDATDFAFSRLSRVSRAHFFA
jgi:hypothetical protein